jgi:hypothetical protein
VSDDDEEINFEFRGRHSFCSDQVWLEQMIEDMCMVNDTVEILPINVVQCIIVQVLWKMDSVLLRSEHYWPHTSRACLQAVWRDVGHSDACQARQYIGFQIDVHPWAMWYALFRARLLQILESGYLQMIL